MQYKTCSLINRCAINFNRRIDIDRKHITFCCERIEDRPALSIGDSVEETLKKFMKLRNDFILESINLGLNGENNVDRNVTKSCMKCPHYLNTSNIENLDNLIHYVNLSMYPAPCQCKCVYCDIHEGDSDKFVKEKHGKYYDKLFELLRYAKNNGFIAPDVTWQVSAAEITIHPYKDEIMDLVSDDRAVFYTNGFIFDEKIAKNLSKNPKSSINLSIDAGTSVTWERVKGVDNFSTVISNLEKYCDESLPGQITLKYIILPGINDNIEDFISVVDIMKKLKCNHLKISRDVNKKYGKKDEKWDALIKSAGYLVGLLTKNGMTSDLFTYTPDEEQKIKKYAEDLINSKNI